MLLHGPHNFGNHTAGMKKLTLMAILAFATVFPGLRIADAASAPQPHVEFAFTDKDFGTVKMGQAVSLEFQIRNTGSATLIIKEARHSLPQIKIRYGPKIAPGGTGKITVQIDTSQIAGEIGDTIALLLNDPDQPSAFLTVKGVVVPPVDIIPRPVVFFSVYQGEAAERSLIVTNNQERPLAISRLEPQGDHFKAVVESLEAGRRYQLRVTVPSDATPGRYRESVILHTDDPKYARLSVAVNVLVKRDVHVTREDLNFGQLDLTQLRQNSTLLPLLTKTFLIKRRAGEMAILEIETDIPFLEIVQDPPERSQTFRIDVGLNMDRIVPGTIDGTIRIKTDDTEFPELTLPVRGEVH
jgi:hypothetical protein